MPPAWCGEVDRVLITDAQLAGRVKKMSAETQFLFITHNRITMEMAERLVGVTMPEPGVSRPVAVDVEDAIRMAA